MAVPGTHVLYGATGGDFIGSGQSGGPLTIQGGITLMVWTLAGVQVTDLYDASEAAATVVVSDDFGNYRFYAPKAVGPMMVSVTAVSTRYAVFPVEFISAAAAQATADAAQVDADAAIAVAAAAQETANAASTASTDENIQDKAAGLLTGVTHTNITATYNDTTGKITLVGSGGGPGGVDVTAIHQSGDETAAGIKTFTSNIVETAAAPTLASHLTRKDYVDAAVAGGSLPGPVTPLPVVTTPTRTVACTNRTQFLAALADLQWGDKITLAGATATPTAYGSTSADTVITTPSLTGYTVDNPPPGVYIVALNGLGAQFDRGTTYTSGYSMFLSGCNYLQLEGVKIRGGQKGLMAHRSNFNRVINCDVGNVGMELVHWRIFSSFNLTQGCTIHDSGLAAGEEGKSEGIYFGQSESTWSTVYAGDSAGGLPDRSNGNQAVDCTMTNIKSECVDIKEGTAGGLVRGCTMNGSQISGVNNADSFIDCKGNDYLIEDNVCASPSTNVIHAFETHINYAGYGNRNVFKNNTLVAGNKTGVQPNSPTGSQGINILLSGSRGSATGNVVYDDNTVTLAPGGLTNIPTTAAVPAPGSGVTAASQLSDYSTLVLTTGAQGIAGTKTFSSNIVIGEVDPLADDHATRKDYVDVEVATRSPTSHGHNLAVTNAAGTPLTPAPSIKFLGDAVATYNATSAQVEVNVPTLLSAMKIVTGQQTFTPNNVVLEDVLTLTFAVAASTNYRIHWMFRHIAPGPADVKLAVVFPAGVTTLTWCNGTMTGYDTAIPGVLQRVDVFATDTVGTFRGLSPTHAMIEGDLLLMVGDTAGTFKLQTANATAATGQFAMLKSSFLEWFKV